MQDIVLIVDDDEIVARTLYKVMKSNSLDADIVSSGEEALSKIHEKNYSLMLLDINMSGIDGFEVLNTLREQGNNIPVIIVSGRKEDYDALYGLDLGADEYITKPFNPVTLGGTVKALIRRSKGGLSGNNTISAGPFSFDANTLRLFKNGVEIPLSGKEYVIIKLFLDNINRVFSKELLYELVWDKEIPDDNTVMVYINHLRQKIEDDPSHPKYIQTIRGIGYKFTISA